MSYSLPGSKKDSFFSFFNNFLPKGESIQGVKSGKDPKSPRFDCRWLTKVLGWNYVFEYKQNHKI